MEGGWTGLGTDDDTLLDMLWLCRLRHPRHPHLLNEVQAEYEQVYMMQHWQRVRDVEEHADQKDDYASRKVLSIVHEMNGNAKRWFKSGDDKVPRKTDDDQASAKERDKLMSGNARSWLKKGGDKFLGKTDDDQASAREGDKLAFETQDRNKPPRQRRRTLRDAIEGDTQGKYRYLLLAILEPGLIRSYCTCCSRCRRRRTKSVNNTAEAKRAALESPRQKVETPREMTMMV